MSRRGHKELPETLRTYILALRVEGYTYKEIGEKLSIAPSTAFKTVARALKHGTLKSLPRSGRPPALSETTCRLVVRKLTIYRFEPYSLIAKRIGNVTARQVQSIAHKKKYRRFLARRKPFLDRIKAVKHLVWAHENRMRNWNTVMWTDEVPLETGGKSHRPRVTRRAGEAYLPKCIAPTFQSGRKSLMAWGCIAHGYKGPLIRLEVEPCSVTSTGRKRGGGVGARVYVDQVISGPMKDCLAHLEKERGHPMLVVEDGAPSHWGKAAKVAREKYGIQQLAHPPNSPDLNPIEPIWRLLKNRIDSIPESRKDLEHLWATAQSVWDSITVEEVNKHTGKMNARVTAVIKAKGFQTPF